MTPLASDVRAFRQRLVAGLTGFLLSLAGFVGLRMYFVLRYVVVAVLSPAHGLAHGRDPLATRLILFHVLLCGLVAVLGRLIVDVLAMLGRARRFRLRASVLLQIFVVWPVAAAVFIAVYEATR